MRSRLAWALVLGLVAATAASAATHRAGARAAGAVPRTLPAAGNWEATGSGGASFEIVLGRAGRRTVASIEHAAFALPQDCNGRATGAPLIFQRPTVRVAPDGSFSRRWVVKSAVADTTDTFSGRIEGETATVVTRAETSGPALGGGTETCDTGDVTFTMKPTPRLAIRDGDWVGQAQNGEAIVFHVADGGRLLDVKRVPPPVGLDPSLTIGTWTTSCDAGGTCQSAGGDSCARQLYDIALIGPQGDLTVPGGVDVPEVDARFSPSGASGRLVYPADWAGCSTTFEGVGGAAPSALAGLTLAPMNAQAKAGSRFTGPLALLTRPPGAAGALPPSISASIDWGDGTSSAGTVKQILPGSGRDLYVVVGAHTYRRPGDRTATVALAAQGTSGPSVRTDVTVDAQDPTATFFSNPSEPTNGDVALLVPAPASELQRPVERYVWHFSDGYPVIDTPQEHKHYLALLRGLAADPSSGSLKDEAVKAGILPPGGAGGAFGVGGLSADQVRQVVGVWLDYFPHHMVPHIYPQAGTTKVALEVTDSAGKTSVAKQDVKVSDHCLEWGGPISGVFGHATTCDTVNGLAAVAAGPRRRPDYFSFELSFGVGFASGGVSLTITHDGNVFLGLRGSLGPSLKIKGVGVPVSLSVGYVGAPSGDPPLDQAIDNFVVGLTIPVQAALGPFGMTFVLNPSPLQAGVEYAENMSANTAALTLGASCSIDLGRVPGLSQLAPPDRGPWPPSAPAPTLTPGATDTVWGLVAQDAFALRGCGD